MNLGSTLPHINIYIFRSLYPSAMFFGTYPYNSPHVYSRGLPLSTNNFCGSYCYSKNDSDVMSLTYSKNEGSSEQIACRQYIKEWKKNNLSKSVLRVAWQNSIGGQIMLQTYLDLLIIAKDPSNPSHIYYYVFEFAGSFFHGHIPQCKLYDPDCIKWKAHIQKRDEKYQYFERIKKFYTAFNINMIFKYTELFDCQCNHYLRNPLIPKKKYNYKEFLDNIYSKDIEGFLVLNGLSILKSSRAPYQGILFVKVAF